MATEETSSDYSNGFCEFEKFDNDSTNVRTLAVTFDENVTDIVLCDYSDKQFLILTQFQKLGTLISVAKGTTRNLNEVSDVYDVKTLCGTDNEEYHLAARYLAQQLQISKPIVFSISLKDYSLRFLKAIIKVLKDNNFF